MLNVPQTIPAEGARKSAMVASQPSKKMKIIKELRKKVLIFHENTHRFMKNTAVSKIQNRFLDTISMSNNT